LVEVVKERRGLGAFDAELFGDLPARRALVTFARADDAAHEHVVHTGEHILRERAPVDVELPPRVPADDAHATMQQVSATNLPPRGGADHAILLVHEVNDLLSRRRWHLFLLSQGVGTCSALEGNSNPLTYASELTQPAGALIAGTP